MVTIDEITEMALSFEEAVEQPHFHKSSFRVRNKIFATLDSRENTVVLKFSNHEQSVFADFGAIKAGPKRISTMSHPTF